jgi:hypothetical protein
LLTTYGQRPIAFASYRLNHLPVIDAQIPAPVSNRFPASCMATAVTVTPHAQVLGDSLLSNLNHIIFYAICKEQQSNRKSLLYCMENGASGSLRDLRDVLARVS